MEGKLIISVTLLCVIHVKISVKNHAGAMFMRGGILNSTALHSARYFHPTLTMQMQLFAGARALINRMKYILSVLFEPLDSPHVF